MTDIAQSMFGPPIPVAEWLDWLKVAAPASRRDYYRERVCNWLAGADALIGRIDADVTTLKREYDEMKAFAATMRTAHARREAFDDALAQRYHECKSRLTSVQAMKREALSILNIVGE